MYSTLQLAYSFVLFLVASFSIFMYIKKDGRKQDFLYIYLGVSFCLEFGMFVLQTHFSSTSSFGFLYNAYILFCSFFFLKYYNQGQRRGFIVLNNIIFLLFLIIYTMFLYKSYKEVNQVIGISFSLVYILYSLIWMYGKLKYPDFKSITADPKFWISCALLFWGVFFLLRIIPRYLFNQMDVQVLIISQSFFFVINIFFYFLFFIGLIKYLKKYE